MRYGWEDFKNELTQPPNLLSLSRLSTALLCVHGLIPAGLWWQAFIWYQIGTATDAADGFMARYFGWETYLGKALDPLSDKVLVLSVSWLLVPPALYVWWWRLLGAELALFGFGLLAFFLGEYKWLQLGANRFGKAKFILEGSFVYFMFAEKIGWPTGFSPFGWQIVDSEIALRAAVLCAVMSIAGHFGLFRFLPKSVRQIIENPNSS